MLDADERGELERLRRENAELRLDRAFLKKSRGLLRLRAEPVEAYRLIEAEKATYTIKRMCEVLEVSRAGYYIPVGAGLCQVWFSGFRPPCGQRWSRAGVKTERPQRSEDERS